MLGITTVLLTMELSLLTTLDEKLNESCIKIMLNIGLGSNNFQKILRNTI